MVIPTSVRDGKLVLDLSKRDATMKADLLENLAALIDREWFDGVTIKQGVKDAAAAWRKEASS